jgi:hypothetical protein
MRATSMRAGNNCEVYAEFPNGRLPAKPGLSAFVRRGSPYSPHAANASLNARSPGAPFSIAMMARRWLT